MSRPQDNHYSGPPPAYDVQTTYIPNDEVVPAVVPAQHGAPPPGSFGGPRGPPPPGGQYGPPGQYGAPRGPPGGPYPPRGASPGPGSMPRGPPPGQPGGPPPGLSFTESTANSYVSGNIGRPPVPPSGPSTTERQALIPTGRPQSDEPAPNINSSTAELPNAAFGRSQEEVEADSAKYAFYNARRYRPYFNIDTRDVWWRITRSLIGPFRADFMEVTMKRPDLYGPFWGSTTLIFITAVAGNLASYIAWVKQKHKDERQPPLPPGAAASPPTEDLNEWYSDIGKLGTSAALIYGYVFIIGLLLYFVLRYFKGEMKLVNVWCIYGYALTIFVPVSLLCVIPIGWLRWVLVMVATAISGLFLLRNFKAVIFAAAPAKASLMLIIIAALHVGLGITLRLFFFGYK